MLCITHTPQVAAFADNQLLIQKNVRKDRTFTEIHTLDMDGRVEVLARMISGDKVSELSLASARELIEKSNSPRAGCGPMQASAPTRSGRILYAPPLDNPCWI